MLNIAEIHSSPTGGRGIIPLEASAELALRTPPGIDHTRLLAHMYEALNLPALVGVQLIIDDSYPGYRFSIDEPGVLESLNSYYLQRSCPKIWP